MTAGRGSIASNATRAGQTTAPVGSTGAVEREEELRSGGRSIRPRHGCGRPIRNRDRAVTADGGGGDWLLVGCAERDLLDSHRGGGCDDRAHHAQPEGLGGREAERPVDALDDGRDGGLRLGRERLGEDPREVTNAGQLAEVDLAAGLGEALEYRRRDTRGHHLGAEVVLERG